MKTYTVTLIVQDDVQKNEIESAVRYGLDVDTGFKAGDFLMTVKEES